MQKALRRLMCILAAGLLLLAAACNMTDGEAGTTKPTTQTVETTEAPKKQDQTLTLPFAKRDVLNPYAAATQLNMDLLPLLYEGLFTVDDTFKAQPVLAEKITKQTATQWTVQLRQGRVFHNGTPVKAADVIYSFNKARINAHYAPRLANISRLQEKEGILQITLKKANEFIAACLDFPIVPDGSANEGALSQAVNGYVFTLASTPSGTGRYALKKKDGVFYLAYDEQHPGAKPTITTIEFYGVSSTGALLYGLEMGNYHFAYDDLSGGTVERVSAGSARVPTTNLLYLTFNRGRSGLSDAKLRAALAACIDKTKALGESFAGYAQATDTPFPPKWHGVNAVDFASPFDPVSARKSLEALGYTETRDGVRASRYRKLSFTLLVNKDNAVRVALARAIKSQFAALQIGVDVQALPQNEYISAARYGRFDLCLGEIRLTPDCDLSPLLLTGGAASAGIDVWGRAPSAYGQLLQGLLKPAEFVGVFRDEVPFLPIGYRCGMAVSARKLRIPGSPRQNDLFHNIEQWGF